MSWIKVEHALPDKPEVFALAAELKITRDAAIGKLIRLWLWCDMHTVDGNASGVTETIIDEITLHQGFSAALLKVGWMQLRSGSVVFPRFDRHNGQTAKARAETNRRVANHRVRRNAEGVTDVTPTPLPKPLPEKIREEHTDSPSLAGVRERVIPGAESEPGTPTTPEIPTLEQVMAFAKLPTSNIPSSVASAYFHRAEACGWIDHLSRPIRNWRADLHSYHTSRGSRKPGRGGRDQAPSSFGGDLMNSYVGTARTAANDPDLANFLPTTGGQK